MVSEVFSSTNYQSAWAAKSDVWVLLSPDNNPWTHEIDWSLGMLLRRALVREGSGQKSNQPSKTTSDFLLLAAPEGLPASRVLVVQGESGTEANWLKRLAPILKNMKASSATVFAPANWRPPSVKNVAEISDGEWGLRWVESPTP